MGSRLAVAAIVLCVSASARAQDLATGTIEGRMLTSEGRTVTNGVVRASGADGVVREGAVEFDGHYRLRALPPGIYRIGFWLGRFEVVHVDEVVIRPGEVTTLTVRGPGTPEPGPFDPTSSALTTTIARGLLEHGVRPGFDIDAMFGVAPTAHGDAYGIGFAGSDSLENRYVIDDVDVTGVVYPELGVGLPIDLVQEAEVITGGARAARAGFTGGSVRVVTPHGGDRTHGSVFAMLAPGLLRAAEERAPSQGSTIETHGEQVFDALVGAEIGGRLVKGHAWYWLGVVPRWASATLTRKTRTQVDRDQDGSPDLDPETGFEAYEDVDESTHDEWSRGVTIAANVDGVVSRKQRGGLSVLISPTFGRTVRAQGIVEPLDTRAITTDVAARWFSRLERTSFAGVIGVHRSTYRLRSGDGLDDVPEQALYFGDLGEWSKLGGESSATRAACSDDANDPYPQITNCPGSSYTIGGPGALTDDGEQRVAAQALVQRHSDALGVSEFSFGLGIVDERAWRSHRTSGDRTISNYGSDITITRPVEIRAAGAPGTAPCMGEVEVVGCDGITAGDPGATARAHGLTWSMLIEEQWRPVTGLTAEMALRRDAQTIDDVYDGTAVWTARMGMGYDPTREGRARIYMHWGQYHEAIPLSVAMRNAFSGSLESRSYTADQCGGVAEGYGGADGAACDPDDPAVVGTTSVGNDTPADPDLIAPLTEEVMFGWDHELRRGVTFGFAYVHRQLRNVLEDVGTDGTDLHLANPGLGLHEDLDLGRRDYHALQLQLAARRGPLTVQASYVISETDGNYPGLYSANNGQLDPHLSSQYDLVELAANRDGALPQDRTHYVKIDGYYELPRGFTVGARLRALSGTPIDVLGKHYRYGQREVFILPRGAAGRTDFTYGVDLHADYAIGRFRVFADLLNATNSQSEYAVDSQYTYLSNTAPIVGGSYEDLVWAKEQSLTSGAETSTPIKRNPHFGHTSTRYAPLSLQLGARVTF